MLDPMNMTLGHIYSSSLDLSPKIFGRVVVLVTKFQFLSVRGMQPTVCILVYTASLFVVDNV